MKLDKDHIAILRAVREKLDEAPAGGGYICLMVMEETQRAREAELSRAINRVMFWRRLTILNEWCDRREELLSAIRRGLDGFSTVGNWIEHKMRRTGVKIQEKERNNMGLYKMIRRAWLDRVLETGIL